MSAAFAESLSPEARFAEDYRLGFDDFVRHMRGQGFRVTDRVLEGAHDRAAERATAQARSLGVRHLDFAALSKSALAQSLRRYGY
jgi:hypothetical protein